MHFFNAAKRIFRVLPHMLFQPSLEVHAEAVQQGFMLPKPLLVRQWGTKRLLYRWRHRRIRDIVGLGADIGIPAVHQRRRRGRDRRSHFGHSTSFLLLFIYSIYSIHCSRLASCVAFVCANRLAWATARRSALPRWSAVTYSSCVSSNSTPLASSNRTH